MNHNDLKAKLIAEFWKTLADNQFVKSTNSITGEVQEYPPAIVDMEATVSINGEFDKYAIDDFLSRTYDEIARAAGEAGKVKERHKENYERAFARAEKAAYNAAIAQSSRQLAEHFGELEASN